MRNTHHLRKWHRWQRASIASVARARSSRVDRGESDVGVFDDYSMTFVCISTSVERDLCEVLSRDGTLGKLIDAYLLRLLQYVARTSGVLGEIHLPPGMWGPTILSRPWDIVSIAKGKRAFAAFKAAGIVAEGPATIPPWLEKYAIPTSNSSRDDENACSAASASASASGTEGSPPSPQRGVTGKRLRGRDWKRLPRCLRYHAVVNRNAEASRLGRLLRDGDLSEEDAMAALQRFRVPNKNLVNFERNG